jgi:hypothetical protein
LIAELKSALEFGQLRADNQARMRETTCRWPLSRNISGMDGCGRRLEEACPAARNQIPQPGLVRLVWIERMMGRWRGNALP